MMHKFFTTLLCSSFIFSYGLNAITLTVNSNLDSQPTTGGAPGELRFALNAINQAPNTYQVVFALPAGNETIALQGMLPVLNQNAANNLLIDGSNASGSGVRVSLNGASSQRGFIAQQGPITIQNMTIQNTVANGGAGGSGSGGGGMGAGSALFINQAQVVLSNINLVNNVATGGSGGAQTGNTGGGGGMGGAGGSAGKSGGGGLGGNGGSDPTGTFPGGGGGVAPGGNGGSGGSVGEVGSAFGSAAAGNSANGTAGGARGGGGGSGTGAANNAGGGGISGGNGTLAAGGNGGFGGGGGGGAGNGGFGGGGAVNGNGGFGGGGGNTGNGGFGGGGGGSATVPGVGGVGGAPGILSGPGGGGAGFGGGVFVNASAGGTLSVNGDFLTQSNSAIAGPGAASAGNAIFSTTGSPLTFNPGLGQQVTINESIGDDSANSLPGPGYTVGTAAGIGIVKNGAGTLTLLGNNTFADGVTLNAGVLVINNDAALGQAGIPLDVTGNSTLQAAASFASTRPISLATNTLTFNTNGNDMQWIGAITGTTGGIVKDGAGILLINGANTNTYTGPTNVLVGGLIIVNNANNTFSSPLSVAPGAELDLDQAPATKGTYSGGISGAGSLLINVQGGTGIVELTGPMTFTGDTTVYNGTLQGTPTSLPLNITDNAGAIVDIEQASGSGTYTGVITGDGAVVINSVPGNNGTVIVTGNNTYTGGTTVNAGTLQGTTTSLQGNIVVNTGAIVDFEQNANTVGNYNGNISGGGGVVINSVLGNRGTVIFNGVNTYTGGTTVNAGILQGTTTSLQGNIFVNTAALLDFEQAAGVGTYNGIISGGGGVVINSVPGDTGTIVFTNNNTYTGGTLVNAGTLQGTTQSVQGDIFINTGAFVDLEQPAGTGISSSNISGGGRLLINSIFGNNGRIILTGTNTYSGGTVVSNGILQGDTDSLQGTIIDNATVEFNQDFNGIFNGNLTGGGILEKKGTGLVRFATDSPFFSGSTNVREGILDLRASLGGNITVFGGGTLSGNGTALGDVTIKNNGRIAPGPNTFTINGNFIQEAGSSYIASFNTTQNSLLDIQQTATLNPGSSLGLLVRDGAKVNTVLTILSAEEELEGQYTNISVLENEFLNATVLYDENHVFVIFKVEFDEVAETFNQRQIAEQLGSLGTDISPELQEVLQEFSTLNPFDARDALDQLSGVQYTNVLLNAEIANRQFTRRIFDPLRILITTNPCTPQVYCTYKPTFDLWASVTGGGQTLINGTKNAKAFHVTNYAFTFGGQAKLCHPFTLGAAISCERDFIGYKVGGSAKSRIVLGGVYALYRPKRFYVFGDVNLSHNINKFKRTINIGSLSFKPKSNVKAYLGSAYVEIGTDIGLYTLLVQPFFAFETGRTRFNKFKEQGDSPLNLNVKGTGWTNSAIRLGVHLTSAPLLFGLSMGLDLSWNYRLTNSKNIISEQFQDFGNPFKIQGIPLQRNSFEAAIVFNQQINKCWSLYFEANGLGSENYFAYSFTGGILSTW